MKLRCEILSVEARSMSLKMKLQGKPPKGAEWRESHLFDMEIPAYANTAKTFYVGRVVTIEIKP